MWVEANNFLLDMFLFSKESENNFELFPWKFPFLFKFSFYNLYFYAFITEQTKTTRTNKQNTYN